MAGQTGGVAQGAGEMAFAQADPAEKDDVGVVVEEGQAQEVLHLGTVDFLGPGPVEGIEGFNAREAGDIHPPAITEHHDKEGEAPSRARGLGEETSPTPDVSERGAVPPCWRSFWLPGGVPLGRRCGAPTIPSAHGASSVPGTDHPGDGPLRRQRQHREVLRGPARALPWIRRWTLRSLPCVLPDRRRTTSAADRTSPGWCW